MLNYRDAKKSEDSIYAVADLEGAQIPGGGGSTQLYCCTHARPQVFRTHPKQVLSIGQIYTLITLFKYFRVLF